MTHPENADQMLTPREVSQLLRLAPQTLARMRSEGRGPKWHKFEAAIRYRRSDVDAYIDACAGGGR